MSLVTAGMTMNLSVTQELTTQADGASSANRKVMSDQFNKSVTMIPTGTAGTLGTVGISQKIALSSGAKTVDLTSLQDINGGTVSASSKKLRALLLGNPSGNAAMTFTVGGTNGYTALGASFVIVLQPKQKILAYLEDGAATIDSTHKTIDVTGTGSQSFEIAAVFG